MIIIRYDNESKSIIQDAINVSGKVFTLKYPCNTSDCTPYAVTFKPGVYKIELWGASGGFLNNLGAHGSYTSGLLPIFRTRTFYIYLGQKGEWLGPPTYNGGGAGPYLPREPTHYVSVGSGGGSSDIRLINGHWSSFESLKSRISVAAGGAGHAYFSEIIEGGAGGVLEGYNGTMRSVDYIYPITNSTSGTQTSPGIGSSNGGRNGGFCFGGNCGDDRHGSGGGSGYYGGGSGGFVGNRVTSGSGGSSYMSGYKGCRAIAKDSTKFNIFHEDSSIHYSGLTFYSPVIKDGKDLIPCTDSIVCTEEGHFGYGYARITIYEQHDPVTIRLCRPFVPYSSIAVFILMNSE